MAERTVDEVNRIIAHIEHMPWGAARTAAALLECNKVEAEGPDECRAYAYNTLVESYNLGGEPEKGYVPFTRVVSLFDAHPEWFDEKDRYDMFWSFKWMVNGLSDYPTVPKKQIEATLADMERRFAENSLGMYAPKQAKFFWSWHIGDPNTEECLNDWEATPRDRMSDCMLCSAGDLITYYVLKGRLEEALERTEAILNNPDARRSCRSEPGSMFAALMLGHLNRNQSGDVAEAVRLYRRVRAFLDDSDQELLSATGRCIVFLAQGHNADLALDYLKRHVERLDDAESPMSRLAFLRGAGGGMRILAEDLGLADTPVPFEGHGDTIGELWNWIREQAETLSAQFDERNQSSGVSDELRLAWSAHAMPEPIDLSVVPLFDDALPEAPKPTQTAPGFARDASDTAPSFVPPATDETGDEVSDDTTPTARTDDGVPETLSLHGTAALDATLALARDEGVTPSDGESDEGSEADAEATSGLSEGQKLLATAERAGRRHQMEAATLYIDAARAFESEGALQDAAFAWAEAGQVGNTHEDYAGAERCFLRALGVLGVIETPINYVVPVALCLVEVLSKQQRWEDAEALIADLHTRVADSLLALEPPAPAGQGNQDKKAKEKAEQIKVRLLQSDLELDDGSAALARALGNFALAGSRSLAVAEAMAELGNVRSAANAFLNAGESLALVKDERAIYAYESAMEAWGILRKRDERINAANHLVDTLRAFGRDEQADELAKSL